MCCMSESVKDHILFDMTGNVNNLQVSLWSSIPHLVPHRQVGSANGIASCLMDLTNGVTSLAIGQVMSSSSK